MRSATGGSSAKSRTLAAIVVDQLPLDLSHLSDADRPLLVEHMVRLVQALLLDPGTRDRSDADLQRFLGACLRPVVHARTMRS